MKANVFTTLVLALLLSFSAFAQKTEQRRINPTNRQLKAYKTEKAPADYQNTDLPPLEGNEEKGPNKQREFFQRLYYPYQGLSPKQHKVLMEEVKSLPEDPARMAKSLGGWTSIGPYGVEKRGTNRRFSGRVRDIELSSEGLRVSAASGGLWEYDLILFIPIPVPLTESLNTQWIGAFASHPDDTDIIFVGTGEPWVHTGTGLWRTDNKGESWTSVSMNPVPSSFFKIEFDPNDSDIIHAATNHGYYRSDDGGDNWTRHLSGIISDIAINPFDSDMLYAGKWGDKMYRSTDGGDTWHGIVENGAPISNVGRINLAIAPSSPNIIYACVVRADNSKTHGIYKSTTNGLTWVTCNINVNLAGEDVEEFHWKQGWYNNAITVSPNDTNMVFAGGGALYKASDGFTFNQIESMHADQHTFAWSTAGDKLYLGNDGGWFVSTNNGSSWHSSLNFLPITQFKFLAVNEASAKVMIGGTQDNGTPYTLGATSNWETKPGDGGGATIDPFDPDKRYATVGSYSGDIAWKRKRTTDGGSNWTDINTGILPCRAWWTKIRTDYLFPPYYYSECNNKVYRSTNQGDNWALLGDSLEYNVWNITLSRGLPVLYACMEPASPDKLMVWEYGAWHVRDTDLPTDTYVAKVATHPQNKNIAYAVMAGVPDSGDSGNKIFKTTNKGGSWQDISGDLPNIPLKDLIAHPSQESTLITCGEFSCFKTTNGGTTWKQWNNGFPDYVLVTEMAFEDSLYTSGEFWIYASTYGRGIWKRKINVNDPKDPKGSKKMIATDDFNSLPVLYQNYPNPAKEATNFEFELKTTSTVSLRIFDSFGRLVKVFQEEELGAGKYRQSLSIVDWSPGIYYYELDTGNIQLAKKMIVNQ